MEGPGRTRGLRKQRIGRVVSDAMDKTIVVLMESRGPHPVYGKTVRHTKKVYAHDEKNEAGIGDKVRVVESRPMSRLKRWRLIEVVKKGPGGGDVPAERE